MFHRGIRIDRIPVKGVAGLIFVLWTMGIFLIWVPATRSFLAITMTAGIVLGPLSYYVRSRSRH